MKILNQSSSAIKSIQRGYGQSGIVDISPVNITKSVVNLNCNISHGTSSGGSTYSSNYCRLKNESQLIISGFGGTYMYWEIIEYV